MFWVVNIFCLLLLLDWTNDKRKILFAFKSTWVLWGKINKAVCYRSHFFKSYVTCTDKDGCGFLRDKFVCHKVGGHGHNKGRERWLFVCLFCFVLFYFFSSKQVGVANSDFKIEKVCLKGKFPFFSPWVFLEERPEEVFFFPLYFC